MPTYTPKKTLGDLLLIEVAPGWTKETGTYVAGKQYPLGTVLAKVSGKWQALDLAATGAAKKAAGVAATDVDATAVERTGPVIARGATLALGELVWPAGATDAQKTTAIDELTALGIVPRAVLE